MTADGKLKLFHSTSPFHNILHSNRTSDIILLLPNGNTVNAHKLVLATASNVWMQLFYPNDTVEKKEGDDDNEKEEEEEGEKKKKGEGEQKEAEEGGEAEEITTSDENTSAASVSANYNKDTNTFTIESITSSDGEPVDDNTMCIIIDVMLDFMYTNTAIIDTKYLPSLFTLSKRYSLTLIIEQCIHYMATSVTVDSAIPVLNMAIQYDLRSAKETVLQLTKHSLLPCLQSSNMSVATSETVLEIMKNKEQSSQVKAVDVFTAVHKWAEAKCGDDIQRKRALMSPLLSFIPLSELRGDELKSIVKPTKVLTDDEYITALEEVV
eukprot:NODE_145_length_1346_cov_368.158326_g141_i0.p1 GENE.NODE_145_length_1346_cov_368.158326_g141_i0~~NODE_145_length_1346_cov_368.158326_g141_i0.p1  ORF type:complete len:379 (-),score=130.57 NODE_145_length_1346_cov_368.158326_g141_i0:209-1177(-)